MKRECCRCKNKSRQKHLNSKYCLPCARLLRKKPKSTLTKAQVRRIDGWIGKIPVTEMAQRLNTSVVNIKRAFRGKSLWFHNGKYINQPDLVCQVVRYYEKHGHRATQKKFKNIRVRSIIEHSDLYGIRVKPRQTRWQQAQIKELARMAGIIHPDDQWKRFKRPNARAGSIKSVWVKKFKCVPRNIHGMAHWNACNLVTVNCPYIKTKWGRLYLWVDMENHLQPGLPNFMTDAIRTMADFQRWLFETKSVKRKINRMVHNRVREH